MDLTHRHPFERLRAQPYPVILESGGDFDADGEQTIAAADPFAVLSVRGGIGTTRLRGRGAEQRKTDAWGALHDFMATHGSSAAIAIGFVSYEAGLEIERIRSRQTTARFLPDLHFAAYDQFDEWPAVNRVVPSRADPVARATQAMPDGRALQVPFGVTSNFDRASYLKAVAQVLEYEHAGDIYQANLSQRFEALYRDDPFRLFAALQETNPAPFAAYLETAEFAIACNSPERLLRGDLKTRAVESRPIKGTAREATTLAMSSKDRAEHLMIVDLVRNDLGRVAEAGTVEVEGFARVVEYPTLCHAVSTVRGKLRDGVGAIEALRALSPGGSVTGCPKIRAMEIIDELERAPRGVYCGSVGYIKGTGEFDFNIAIRTAVVAGGRAYYSAGGAIVADSDPGAEFEETLLKSRAFFKVMERR